MNYHKKLKAFTLAEILIVLGLIGTVIAITIPNLIDRHLVEQRKAGVKKAEAIISKMLLTIQNQNGGTIKGICSDNDNACFKNTVKTDLKYVYECDANVIENGCWNTNYFMDGITPSGAEGSALALSNGTFYLFRWISSSCTNTGNDACGWVAVDINGSKGPNRWGLDTFAFHIQENAVRPYGIGGDTGNVGTCNDSDKGIGSGLGCTTRYLINN